MQSRDQTRALKAYEHIRVVSEWEDKKKKKYGSMVYRLPALIRSAGLSQALHFVEARKSAEQTCVLQHLAEQLQVVDGSVTGSKELLAAVREAPLVQYLSFTQEVLACIDWYRRLVQGELGIDPAEQVDDDH